MPTPRRLRLTALALFASILLLFHYYSSPDPSSPAAYMSTLESMHKTDSAAASAKAKLQASLLEAAAKGRKLANAKAPSPIGNAPAVPPGTKGGEKSVNAGEAKPIDAEAAKREGKVVVERPERIGEEGRVGLGAGMEDVEGGETEKILKDVKEGEEEKEKEKKIETGKKPGEQSVLHDEIAKILNRSPIIIFSKSFCPYSTRAKTLLLHSYAITPPPAVVELDQHPLGTEIQAWLETFTGRSTVPNIVVNSKSIGGSDEIAKLDEEGRLEGVLREAAGRQVSEVRKVVGEKDQ